MNFIKLFQKAVPLFRNDDEATRKFIKLFHYSALVLGRFAQQRMQSRYHWHIHVAEEGEKMAARHTAVDTEFVLNRNHLDVIDVQEIRRPPVRIQLLFIDFKTNPGRVVIPLRPIIHRAYNRMTFGICHGYGLAEIVGVSSDTALPWKVISQKSDSTDSRDSFHRLHDAIGVGVPLSWSRSVLPGSAES